MHAVKRVRGKEDTGPKPTGVGESLPAMQPNEKTRYLYHTSHAMFLQDTGRPPVVAGPTVDIRLGKAHGPRLTSGKTKGINWTGSPNKDSGNSMTASIA